ncbi:hypothetical protein ACOSQ2_004704 [Xanthoceras sorbifolium]
MAAVKGRSGNQNQGRRDRGRNKYSNNGRSQCQICYRMGHIASSCYYSLRRSPLLISPSQVVSRSRRSHLIVVGHISRSQEIMRKRTC